MQFTITGQHILAAIAAIIGLDMAIGIFTKRWLQVSLSALLIGLLVAYEILFQGV